MVVARLLTVVCALAIAAAPGPAAAEPSLGAVPLEGSVAMDLAPVQAVLAEAAAGGASDHAAILAAITALAPDAAPRESLIDLRRDSAEGGRRFRATAIFDAVPDDDSVSGQRFDLVFATDDSGRLVALEGRRAWRCWPDRGHRSFSAERCR